MQGNADLTNSVNELRKQATDWRDASLKSRPLMAFLIAETNWSVHKQLSSRWLFWPIMFFPARLPAAILFGLCSWPWRQLCEQLPGPSRYWEAARSSIPSAPSERISSPSRGPKMLHCWKTKMLKTSVDDVRILTELPRTVSTPKKWVQNQLPLMKLRRQEIDVIQGDTLRKVKQRRPT